jgi:hypothetical protein
VKVAEYRITRRAEHSGTRSIIRNGVPVAIIPGTVPQAVVAELMDLLDATEETAAQESAAYSREG